MAYREEKGHITFSDISSYVKSKVSHQTRNLQVPQYGNIDDEGDFVFVSAAAPVVSRSGKTARANENGILKIEQEKQSLEQGKAQLAAQCEQLEEQKRLSEEHHKLEVERLALENQRKKLVEEKKVYNAGRPQTNDGSRRRFASTTPQSQQSASV